MAESYTPGTWYPEGGLPSHPFSGAVVEGVFGWPGDDGRYRWYISVGSEAWNRFQNRPQKQPVVGVGRETNLLAGPWQSEPQISVEAGRVETGEGDPVTNLPQYANDPDLGVVPVGTPTNQSTLSRIWNTPARLLARMLPAGEVNPTVAAAVNLTPWLIWVLLAWWLWRKIKR